MIGDFPGESFLEKERTTLKNEMLQIIAETMMQTTVVKNSILPPNAYQMSHWWGWFEIILTQI